MRFLLTPFLILILTSLTFADPQGDADAAGAAATQSATDADYAKTDALNKMGEAQMWEAGYVMANGAPLPAADHLWRTFEQFYAIGSEGMSAGDQYYMLGAMDYMMGNYAGAETWWWFVKSAYDAAESAFRGAEGTAQAIIDLYNQNPGF